MIKHETELVERNIRIFHELAFSRNMTYAESAKRHGISPSRVREIYNRMVGRASSALSSDQSNVKALKIAMETISDLEDEIKYLSAIVRDHAPGAADRILEQEIHDHKNIPIESVDLSVRTFSAMKRNNIKYLTDITTLSERDILLIPNMGRKSLNELKYVLSDYGLRLREE